MQPTILFEDLNILVLDKPSGWVVNDAETTRNQITLQAWLSKKNYPLAPSREFRSGIVHRLDKETSGVLVVAKTKEAFEFLQSEFKKRRVEKAYIALLHGKVVPVEGKINLNLGRLPWNRKRFGVLPGGRSSESSYKVVGFYKNDRDNFSLVNFFPKTGRTHQIRVHAKYIGHPVVSDELYAGRKTSRPDRLWCPRLFLHACRLKIRNPGNYKYQTFESGLPDDIKISLATLVRSS